MRIDKWGGRETIQAAGIPIDKWISTKREIARLVALIGDNKDERTLKDIIWQRQLTHIGNRIADAAFAEFEDDDDTTEPTWARQDTADYLNGDITQELPTMLMRVDGVFLLYPGRIHSFFGESESGKTWIVLYESRNLIMAGHDVCYLDFEADMRSVVNRLLNPG